MDLRAAPKLPTDPRLECSPDELRLASNVRSRDSSHTRAKPKQSAGDRLGIHLFGIKAIRSAGHVKDAQILAGERTHGRLADREHNFTVELPIWPIAS